MQGRSASWWFRGAAYTYVVLLSGTNVPTPLYAGYEREFGFSPTVVTLVFASYVASLILSLLVLGPLSDAVGRRRVLLPALLAAIVGSLLFVLAAGTAWLFAGRLVQGVAVGAGSGAVVALLVELEPSGDRRRAALVAAMAPVVGTAIGPLMSGLLAQYVPAPHVTAYLVEIALLVVGVAVVAAAPDVVTRTPWRPRRPQVPAGIRGPFAASAAASFLAWGMAGVFLALAPSYVATLTGIGNLALGGGVTGLLFVCSAVAGRLAYGRSARRQRLAGLVTVAVGLALLLVAGVAGSLTALLAAAVVAGAGHGLAFLGAMSEINRIAPPDRHADVVSSFLVATYVGTGLPVIGAGLLATGIGLLPAVEWFAAGIAVLCLLVAVVLLRTGTRDAPGPGVRADGALHGRVLTEGAPVSGATVTVIDPTGAARAVVRADADGIWRTARVDAGWYVMTIRSTGCRPTAVRVHVGDRPIRYDVTLRRSDVPA